MPTMPDPDQIPGQATADDDPGVLPFIPPAAPPADQYAPATGGGFWPAGFLDRDDGEPGTGHWPFLRGPIPGWAYSETGQPPS